MHTCTLLLLFVYVFLFSSTPTSRGAREARETDTEFRIGAIVDLTSRVGKEVTVAMNMAINDSYMYTRNKPFLHFGDSRLGVSSARSLIDRQKVDAIIGLQAWDAVACTAEDSDRAQVPILALGGAVPSWMSRRWPYVIEAQHSQLKEMDAVAAVVGTWQWRQVNYIYEDASTASSSVSYLMDALKRVGSSVTSVLPLPLSDALLYQKLEELKRMQCRVFVVHTSSSVAARLLVVAKKMGLMENDSVWITTTSAADHFDHVNSSVLTSLQGVLAVRTYYNKTGKQYKDFSSRFLNIFRLEHPEEAILEPGIAAMRAYDTARVVEVASRGGTNMTIVKNSSVVHGQELLESILQSNFKGLTGDFRFVDGALEPSMIFRIVNVVPGGYRELGLWSEGLGFSRTTGNERLSGSSSMRTLGRVLWPGGLTSTPRGWATPTAGNPLLIGVPGSPTFNQFVNVQYDVGGQPSFTGLAIDVFSALQDHLPYNLSYNFVPYNGSYDSLIEQIYHKKFDAVVGDTSIFARRYDLAEFSQPWTESGFQMVVFKKSVRASSAWLFAKPFTISMWCLTLGVNIYNGFVVWLVERTYRPEFNGSPWNKLGSLTWLAFATLFTLQGDRLHSNLTRMTMVVWLFVAIIIIQGYSANLSSLLTLQRMESSEITLDYLRNSNAKVGCERGSFFVNYVKDTLHIRDENIVTYPAYTDFLQAFERKEIVAAFLEVPYIKIWLAEHCNEFAVVEPVYKIGGFGFVFPKGSPILPDVSKAVLEVSESGKLLEMETALLRSYNCSRSQKPDGGRLGVESFWGLFMITGGTTTTALVLFVLQRFVVWQRPTRRTPCVPGHDPDSDERCMFAAEMEWQNDRRGTAEN